MFEMGWFSAKLFLKGKLLRDPLYFWRQTAIGWGVGLVLMVLLGVLRFPLWFPVVVSSLFVGGMMPFLLKDFKMK
ncbi:hypothetical protein [Iningainema tapete]|uniref:Uncharacterized protein n=1 Tax=Iningainema tapete BLCC-T55 TaxID=2748662 RepID=A0A8J6XDE7_9CYAN|nr:hypothetical protein [Iningainema tapete]MBD2773915.1 hypothetical protein [Iningainema tapete BLCC-T55]